MSSRFFQKSLGSKVIAGVVIANLIFTGNVFAVNSLRATAAKDARDGGTRKDIARDLKIVTDGGEATDVSFLRIIKQNVHEGKGSSDSGLGLTSKQLVALIKIQIKKGFKQGLMGAFFRPYFTKGKIYYRGGNKIRSNEKRSVQAF